MAKNIFVVIPRWVR